MKTIREELIEVRNRIDELINLLGTETEVKTFPKRKGRPKSSIFHDWVDEELLANCVSGLHQRYFNPTCRMMEVDNETVTPVTPGDTSLWMIIYSIYMTCVYVHVYNTHYV